MNHVSKKGSGPQLFLSFWKASRAVMRVDQQSITRLGFKSLSDFAVLEVLLNKGPLPVNTIGAKVLLTSGSITSAVQRLEKQELVTRIKDEKDARVVVVHLTKKGRNQIEQAFAQHADDLDEVFEGLSKEERLQFSKLMKKIRLQSQMISQRNEENV
jgi:MarR family 2-MHQ and catechol resistance regulon transcriptional repressor